MRTRRRLERFLKPTQRLSYAGRGPAAAPATGDPNKHRKAQAALVDEALGVDTPESSSAAGRPAMPEAIPVCVYLPNLIGSAPSHFNQNRGSRYVALHCHADDHCTDLDLSHAAKRHGQSPKCLGESG